MVSKGLKNQDGEMPAASDSTPRGTRTMDPAPGGGMIKNIDGPKIHGGSNKGGDMANQSGVDPRTTVESE